MKFINFFLFSLVFLSCNSTSKLYYPESKGRSSFYNLNEDNYSLVKNYLQNYSAVPLKDTLIIKYNFNNETCWDLLDQHGDEFVKSMVDHYRLIVDSTAATKQNTSIFEFRQVGINQNKLKLWDKGIFVDSTNKLYHLLFNESTTCGTSAMVFPDKSYLIVRSDPHFEILHYSKEDIKKLHK